MSDLEHLGLIYAPHTSAGRLPTQSGLRLFVDGLLELGDITTDERRQIEAQIKLKRERSVDQALAEASEKVRKLTVKATTTPLTNDVEILVKDNRQASATAKFKLNISTNAIVP